MSDIRFNQWLHQSGTGGVTQLSSGHVGIGTTNPLIPVHSGNNAVLNVGVVTANNIYAGTLNGTLALSDISGITGSFTSDLTVNGNLDIADKIRHIGDTDTAIRFTANDTVTVETAGNERLRIDSTGKIGIGKVPSRTLDVQGKIRSSDSVCFGDNSSTPSEGAAIHRPAASTLAFVTNNTERVRIDSSGDLSISDGNLVVASGHGIDFSATADPSFGNTSNRQELLDDYEEGQWVPEYSGATAAGSVSYSYRKGYYIKIGAQVTVWIEMTVSSASGMSGSAQISNLPFNKNELGSNDATNTGTYYYSGTTNWYIQYHAQNKPIFTGWMPNNSNVIRIYNADHWGGVTGAPLNTNGRMSFSYTYTTSA